MIYCRKVLSIRECVRNSNLRVQVHHGEPWIPKQQVHIVLNRSLKISGCKRWCPKDLQVCAPAAPALTHSLQNIWTFTNLHWLSVDNRRKLGMRRISEAGIEAMAVQIVVDHWRLGRASATPRHWSRCCATYTVLSNTTGSSSVTVLEIFIYFG